MNAVFERFDAGDRGQHEAQLRRRIQPGLAGRELALFDVMWSVVYTIDVGFVFEILDVVGESLPLRFVVVYHTNLARCQALRKPDGGLVPNAQIPVGVHGQLRVVGHMGNPAVDPGVRDLSRPDGAFDGSIEGAFVLFGVLLGGHNGLRFEQNVVGDESGFGRFEQNRVPARFLGHPTLVGVIESVFAVGGAQNEDPVEAVGAERGDNFGEQVRRMVLELVQDEAVKVNPSQGVRVIGPVDANQRPVGERDAQFRVIDLDTGDFCGKLDEVVPAVALLLGVGRPHDGKMGAIFGRGDGRLDELVHRRDGFPHAAMADGDRERVGLDGVVDHPLLGAGRIRNFNFRQEAPWIN